MQSEVEFIHKALHSYNNVQACTLDEFNEDLNKILGIRKIFSRYLVTGELAHRLILNHLVILFNVFGSSTLDLILYKVPKEQYPQLFPFLLFLHRLPEHVINKENVTLDENIIKALGKL